MNYLGVQRDPFEATSSFQPAMHKYI